MPSRAGSRTQRFRPGFGRLSELRAAFLRTESTGVVNLQALDPEEHDEENGITLKSETGTAYVILIPNGRYRPITWNLSNMTEAELQATRQFFDYAFDQAEPIVRERDKVAQDAYEAGDDSYSRVYRAIPQFVVRERKKSEHSQGVHDGPEGSSG